MGPRITPRLIAFCIAAFGSLLIPGILNAGVVPQKLSLILIEYQLSDLQFGYLAGSIATLAAFLGVSAAWLIPRLGAYRVCILGYIIFAVGMVGVARAPTGWAGACMGILVAWGMAYLHQGNGLVVQLAPHRAAIFTNLLHGINALGKAIGPTFALIGTGWRDPFLALAGIAAVLGIIGMVGKISGTHESEPDMKHLEGPAKQVLGDPLFWSCTLLFIPILGMELLVTLWLPKYIVKDIGMSEEGGRALAHSLAAIMLWTMCIGRFSAAFFLNRVAPLRYLIICTLGTLGLWVGTESGQWSTGLGVLSMVLFGIGCSAAWPTFFALSCRYFPNHKGLFSIVSGVSSTLAWIIFSLLGGLLGTHSSHRSTLRIAPLLGLIVILGAIGISVVGERRIRKEAAASGRRGFDQENQGEGDSQRLS